MGETESYVEMGAELVVFDIKDAEIALLREDYMKISVQGLDDKPGLDACHKARIHIKGLRVAVTKRGKEYRDKLNVYINKELAEEKRLLSLLEPIEAHLAQEESRVTEELARIKAEAAAKEAARIKARVDQLYKLDCRFDGFTWMYSGVEIAPQSDIIKATDAQFAELVKSIQDAIDEAAEVLRLQEEARLIEAERLRKVAEEQEAERQRLEEVKRLQEEEMDKFRAQRDAVEAKLKADQAALEAEKQRIIKEEADKKTAESLARIRAEKEKAEKEAEEKRLAAAVEAAKVAEAERIRLELEAKAKKEAAAKLAAERKAARQPDKKKLMSYIQILSACAVPELKTSDGVEVLVKINGGLNELLGKAEAWIGEL